MEDLAAAADDAAADRFVRAGGEGGELFAVERSGGEGRAAQRARHPLAGVAAGEDEEAAAGAAREAERQRALVRRWQLLAQRLHHRRVAVGEGGGETVVALEVEVDREGAVAADVDLGVRRAGARRHARSILRIA